MSDIIIAFILGIVERLAEFSPISSTGYLILAGHLLGFEGEWAKTFEIVIQLGAILAITILYHKRLVSLCNIKSLLRKEKNFNALHVFLGVFPAVVAGLLLHNVIKTYLFQPYTVVVGLVAGALLMIFAETKKTEAIAFSLDDLTYRQALTVCSRIHHLFYSSNTGSNNIPKAFRKDRFKTLCILSYFVSYLIYAFRIAIDSYKSHIIKTIFKLEYRFFIYLTSSITHFNMK